MKSFILKVHDMVNEVFIYRTVFMTRPDVQTSYPPVFDSKIY